MQTTKRPHQFWQLVRNFAKDSRGDAGVEYALLISMMVAAVFLGAELVQSATNGTFQRACSAMGGNVQIASVSPAAPRVAPSNVPAETDHELSVFYAQFGTAIMALLVTSGLIMRRSRRRRDSSPQKLESHSPQHEAMQIVSAIFEKRQAIFRQLAREKLEHTSSHITVERLMTRTITCVGPTAKADAVRELMDSRRIRHVLVCSNDERLLGIISDRDVHHREAKNASQLMSASPLTVDLNTEVLPAVTLLLDRRISCLPVVHDGKVVGVLTTTDLLMTLQCLLQLLQRSVDEAQPKKSG